MILHGHVNDKLKEIPKESVQCVVTSPPYWGLRDYGTASWEGGDENCDHLQPHGKPRNERPNKTECGIGKGGNQFDAQELKQYNGVCKKCGAKRIDHQLGLEPTPEEYVEKLVEVFRGIRRVLKQDGTVFLNLGDSYNGSGGPGNQWDNKAKKGGFKKFNNPMRDYKGLKPKDLVGIPWRVAFALQADGWWLRQDIIWHKPNPMPESVTDRCTKSHEYIFLLTKSAKYYYDADAIREPGQDWVERDRSNMRNGTEDKLLKHHGLTGKLTKTKVPSGWDTKPGSHSTIHRGGRSSPEYVKYPEIISRNKRSVWTISPKPYTNAHFAVFPP
ncbi:MAG TPA: site-specific DNA-methyltransferase, partial [Pricia sp.]|nr:site-specific DNA-methyltransferase [Pricia sp.]